MSNGAGSPMPPMSRLEWLGILGLLLFLGLLFFIHPGLVRRGPAHRILCITNLKQVGMGLRQFAHDHNDLYPWQISTNEDGVKEWVGTKDVFRLYVALSNEVVFPKVLLCPCDKERSPATNLMEMSNQNLSYFVGLDARKGSPTTLLFGDRNLCVSGYQLGNGSYYIPTSKVVTWAANIHLNAGNVVLNDGSAHQFNNQKLQTLLNGFGRATNFIAIP